MSETSALPGFRLFHGLTLNLNRFETSSASPLGFDASLAGVESSSSLAMFWRVLPLCNQPMPRPTAAVSQRGHDDRQVHLVSVEQEKLDANGPKEAAQTTTAQRAARP
jgi:hypothetical protein